jgi:hypothetical protein
MKNLKTNALIVIIVFSFAACGTSGGKGDVGTFLNGGWTNTSENDTSRILLDGNNWVLFDNNKAVSMGTWVSSVKPEAGAEGTITFTITQVDMGKGAVNLGSDSNGIKSCTVKYSIDPDGNQLTLSGKKLAAADPLGIWKKLEGVYIRGSSINNDSDGSNASASGSRSAGTGYSPSLTAKQLSAMLEDPFISYIITGSGTSFTARKNGATVGTANQPITDVIDAIKTDANGANAAIQFGNDASVLNIGAVSLSFGLDSGDIWGIIALSGKITSSVSPTINVNSAYVISTADISTSFISTNGNGSAIDNNGTLIINDGRVSVNSANNYGIRNRGGTVIINHAQVSPIGKGIYNDSGSGKGGNVTIIGGTVHSMSGRAIYNSSGCTVTIIGGTVSSSSSETIYNSGGTLTVNGGTVSGSHSGHAILNTDSGTVTITGGTVSTTNTHGSYAAINNDSGCTVTITGGTVTAPTGSNAISNASGGAVTVTSPPAVIFGNISGN